MTVLRKIHLPILIHNTMVFIIIIFTYLFHCEFIQNLDFRFVYYCYTNRESAQNRSLSRCFLKKAASECNPALPFPQPAETLKQPERCKKRNVKRIKTARVPPVKPNTRCKQIYKIFKGIRINECVQVSQISSSSQIAAMESSCWVISFLISRTLFSLEPRVLMVYCASHFPAFRISS